MFSGFWGEIRGWQDGTTIVQKTHDASKNHVIQVLFIFFSLSIYLFFSLYVCLSLYFSSLILSLPFFSTHVPSFLSRYTSLFHFSLPVSIFSFHSLILLPLSLSPQDMFYLFSLNISLFSLHYHSLSFFCLLLSLL